MRFIKKKAGFVLVELIIATVILGAVFPLSIYFINTMKLARETKIQQTANYVAQKYMEDFKQKDLAAIIAFTERKETISGRDYFVSVELEPFLASVDASNLLGNMEIAGDGVGGKTIKLNGSNFDGSWQEYILKFSNSRLYLLYKSGGNTYALGSVLVALPAGDPELNLYIKNNPYLTMNVENTYPDKKLIINQIAIGDNPLFTLRVTNGKVGIRDSVSIENYERGANIIVTVKDKAGASGEVLAKVAQTRLIEWSFSQS